MVNNLGFDPIPDPVGHFAFAGGGPLGWYFDILVKRLNRCGTLKLIAEFDKTATGFDFIFSRSCPVISAA